MLLWLASGKQAYNLLHKMSMLATKSDVWKNVDTRAVVKVYEKYLSSCWAPMRDSKWF